MSSWAGFTDEELSRLRDQTAGEPGQEGPNAPGGRKKATINSAKRQRPRDKIRTRASPADVKAPLYKQEEQEEYHHQVQRSSSTSKSNEKSSSRHDSREEETENSSPECERRPKNKQIPEEAPPKITRSKEDEDACKRTAIEYGAHGAVDAKTALSNLPEIIDEKEKIQAMELSALQKMQEKQKQIEEENKRKKAALQETIKKRYQRTQAEAHTLSLVQKELSHLDSLLSADVAILRDKIEESSREYLSAQKRYEKAEQEFVEAKMNLHRKTERKDLLTEHLYTIIRENELRKAKKLEELMAKLDVSPEGTALVHQSSSLEVRSEDSASKQTNADISVSQAGKTADSKDLKSNSESINPQNHPVQGTTTCKETNVFVTQTDNTTTESLAENAPTVTS